MYTNNIIITAGSEQGDGQERGEKYFLNDGGTEEEQDDTRML